ncbi:MAG: hypothetical protein ACI4I9_00965 [Porcipelethomonas sp.]
MDTFSEQLVKKRKSQGDSMKKLIIIVSAVIICLFFAFMSLMYIEFAVMVVIAFFAVGFGAYWLITGLNIEYEYSITNGEIDVDKIIAKRKRAHMLSVEVKNFTAFGTYESADDGFSGTTVMAAGEDEEIYYADFNSEEYGETRLVFSPDEKFMKCIKLYLPRNLKF